jgi:AAA+ ATPase superfamily predicted ATPase
MTPRSAKKIALKLCKPFYTDNGFARWIFPVIRNMSPHDFIDQLIAEQPRQEAVPSEMFYLDFVYNSRWERFKRWVKSKLRTRRRQRLCNICGHQRCAHLGVGLVFRM